MVFEDIEELKRKLTDKYVVVDESRPELRRFKNLTGTVKTVNMSGRALVQFEGNNNIGWFDIDPAYLKIIDGPLAKVETKKGEAKGEKAKPAAAAKPATKEAKVAPPAKAAVTKPAGGAASTADILAAARGGGKPAAKIETAPASKPVAGDAKKPTVTAGRTGPGTPVRWRTTCALPS